MTRSSTRWPHQASLRRSPTQDRAVAKRQTIIAGAKALLMKHGIEGFSIRRVAQSAGIGLGTIYDYFPSRDDLLHVLVEDRLEHRIRIFDSTMTEVSADEGLAIFVPAYVARLRAEGFWSDYDRSLRDAAASNMALSRMHDWYVQEIASKYVAGMVKAGSDWPEDELLRVAQFNMAISQQLEGFPLSENAAPAYDLMPQLVANALITNLKFVLKPLRERRRTE